MITEDEVLSFQTEDWAPIPRISRFIPFGYEVDPEDPDVLQPNILQLETLKQAKIHLKQFSYREVANWITATTGRSISYTGLKKRIESEKSRRNKAAALRGWAERIEKAKAKAEALERNYLGATSHN